MYIISIKFQFHLFEAHRSSERPGEVQFYEILCEIIDNRKGGNIKH